MWTTTPNYNTSLHESMMDRPQTSETVPTDNDKTQRLYPSLPNIDRYDICVPKRSIEQKLQTAMHFHPEGPLEDTQSDMSAASGHVKMKAQMLILEEQRQELLCINEKWAKEYRTMVQYYKQKVQDLKALLQKNHSPFEDEMCGEEELRMAFYKNLKFNKDKERKWTEDSDAVSELLKAKEEVKELRAQNSTLTRRGQHQHEEIKRLNKALEEALLTAPPLGCSETLQDLWKQQAEVYKEDFLKERKDREKLKDKYLELKKKFIKVHRELCVLKSQVTWTPPQPAPECSCTNRAKCSKWEVRPANTQLQRCCTGDNEQ